jgi:hypothetical protein
MARAESERTMKGRRAWRGAEESEERGVKVVDGRLPLRKT